MNWQVAFKAKALRFFFDHIAARKPGYVVDGVPARHDDTWLEVPTAHGTVRTLVHRPVGSAAAGGGPLPVVMLIHGGGFVFGRPQNEALFCRRLAHNVGCAVINPAYALAPEHPFPTATLQCDGVLEWVAHHAASLGLDARRMAVAGHSAGGNLATVTAAQAVKKGFPKLCLQILDYPFLDGHTPPEKKTSPIAQPMINPGLAGFFNGCYMPSGTPLRDPLLSPVYADAVDLAGHPPVLMITAEYDTLRGEAERYVARLREAGVPVRHEMFEGVDHSFTHTGPKTAADAAWRLMEQALTEAFASAAG
jgi:acetyl esterase